MCRISSYLRRGYDSGTGNLEICGNKKRECNEIAIHLRYLTLVRNTTLTKLCQIDETFSRFGLIFLRTHFPTDGVHECDDAQEAEYERPYYIQDIRNGHKLKTNQTE